MMHRIERTPFNEYESSEPEQPIEEAVGIVGTVIAWAICILAFLWLWSVVISALVHYERWKWMVTP